MRPTGDMPGNAMAADEENDGVGQRQIQGFVNGEKKFNRVSWNILSVFINKNKIIAVSEVQDDQKDTGQSCIAKTLTEK